VVKREDFVPEALKALAFADLELPIGNGQTMLQPKIEARILQEVGIRNTDIVLRGRYRQRLHGRSPGVEGRVCV
jgi:protein-L-isoaspartate(D-aspartate) O-methyltransferase